MSLRAWSFRTLVTHPCTNGGTVSCVDPTDDVLPDLAFRDVEERAVTPDVSWLQKLCVHADSVTVSWPARVGPARERSDYKACSGCEGIRNDAKAERVRRTGRRRDGDRPVPGLARENQVGGQLSRTLHFDGRHNHIRTTDNYTGFLINKVRARQNDSDRLSLTARLGSHRFERGRARLRGWGRVGDEGNRQEDKTTPKQISVFGKRPIGC